MTEPYTPYDASEEQYEWDYDDKPRGNSKVLWGRVLALAVALFLAFLLGRSTAPEGVPQSRLTALEHEIDELQAENEDLEALLTEPSPTPTETAAEVDETDEVEGETYTVKSGDTFRGIAQTFCGDPSLDDVIMEANDIAEPTDLRTGMEIIIPADCGE